MIGRMAAVNRKKTLQIGILSATSVVNGRTGAPMSLDETLIAIKARVHDTSAEAVAKEVDIHVDTLRSILSSNPPRWLKTYRRLEAIAAMNRSAA